MKTWVIEIWKSGGLGIRASFVFGFASLASWMPLFNVWLEDTGLSGSEIGFIAAIPWGVMLVVQPAWGVIADKYGKIKCLKFATVLATVFLAFMPFLGFNVATIVTGILVLSIFNTPILPLLDSVALEHVDQTKNTSYSNIRFWGAPGYGIGAVVTGQLIPFYGVEVAFITSSIFLVLMLISVWGFPSTTSIGSLDIEFKDLNNLLTRKLLLIFLIVILIVSIGQSAIWFYLTLYMRQLGASPETTGLALGVQALSELPFYFVAAWLLHRFPARYVVLMAMVGTVIRLFLYSMNSNPELVIFIESMNGITWTLLWVSSVELVNEMVPVAWRTRLPDNRCYGPLILERELSWEIS